jgi:hypothetical protein
VFKEFEKKIPYGIGKVKEPKEKNGFKYGSGSFLRFLFEMKAGGRLLVKVDSSRAVSKPN